MPETVPQKEPVMKVHSGVQTIISNCSNFMMDAASQTVLPDVKDGATQTIAQVGGSYSILNCL